ncbi:hypothetical protein [Massilia sp. AB1]|uniref:hypothetical protein n=1 Tax=Massilia sp. AB1 TaxID=2823371 RepID=UPI001B83F0A3|nr:hypothetical protein [Massilia sp. AB1]MBQ5940041.1 hypothetical protein [Massilia sp. AB1]
MAVFDCRHQPVQMNPGRNAAPLSIEIANGKAERQFFSGLRVAREMQASEQFFNDGNTHQDGFLFYYGWIIYLKRVIKLPHRIPGALRDIVLPVRQYPGGPDSKALTRLFSRSLMISRQPCQVVTLIGNHICIFVVKLKERQLLCRMNELGACELDIFDGAFHFAKFDYFYCLP